MSSSFTAGFPLLRISRDEATTCSVAAQVATHPTQPSDEALLVMVSEGQENALSLLFKRYARLVRGVGQRILRDSAEADDLVQEVFLYIHRRSKLFDQAKGLGRSWIFQVTYTQALIRRRQLKTHGFYLSVMTDEPAESDPSHSKGSHYEFSVECFFGRDGWKNVWDSLTECQQETLRLHFYEGCTFPEIADRLGQSYVNIRHHYYRGLEKLRKHANANGVNWP